MKDATASVFVGTDERPYIIHGNILRSNSSFFEAALKEDWEEGRTREIKLPEEDSAAFARYAKYLYSGTVARAEAEDRHEQTQLAASYVLGEKMLDINYKDCVLNSILALSQTKGADCPGINAVNTVYSGTAENSPARKLTVDLYALYANKRFSYHNADVTAHPEFLLDLVISLSSKRIVEGEERKTLAGKLEVGACTYHSHLPDEPCNVKRQKLS